MKIFILFSLLAFAAQAQTTQANFQSGSKIEASQLNSMINFILDNSYKKQETLVTYTGSGLSTVDNQNLDGEIYNNVLDYQNETVQGDTGIISSDNKRYIIVNQDNVTITLTGTIYHSISTGANYYIHHHTNGVMDKSFVQRFTGIFGGGAVHEVTISRTVMANTGDRIFIAFDGNNMGRYEITVKATRFTPLRDIPIN